MILLTLGVSSIISVSYFKYFKSISVLAKFTILLVPILILLIYASLVSNFNYTITYIIFIPLICIQGYFIRKKKKLKNYIPIILTILFAGFIFFPNQFAYVKNNRFINNPNSLNLSFSNLKNERFIPDNSKTYVFDFWNTTCGVCFKKFPEFEELYLQYKENPNVELYSINVPIKRRDTFNKTVDLVKKLDYEFPTLFLAPEDVRNLEQEYGIKSFPHVLVIKNNQITYSGQIETNPLVFINNIHCEIKSTLKND